MAARVPPPWSANSYLALGSGGKIIAWGSTEAAARSGAIVAGQPGAIVTFAANVNLDKVTWDGIEFTCPDCGARHTRGPFNGRDYRCLRCGYTGPHHVVGPTLWDRLDEDIP